VTSRLLRAAAALGFAALPGGVGTPVPGEPERVDTPEGALAYFLVPDRRDEGIVAVARVLPDGRVASVARLTAPAADCAVALTGLGAARVEMLAEDIAARHGAMRVGKPRLVHDGPIGREAWLLVVAEPGGTRRWVFVTAGGTYARMAGEPLSGGLI